MSTFAVEILRARSTLGIGGYLPRHRRNVVRSLEFAATSIVALAAQVLVVGTILL
jgi:hypothetical protein